MTTLVKIVILLLILYGLLAWSMYIFQRRLMYQPDLVKPIPVNWDVPDMQEVTLQTDDGLTLFSWYKAPNSGKPTIVYFHGNAGHVGTRGTRMRYFLDKGYGIFLLSYRGYGLNPGEPSEKGLYIDATAAMNYVLSQKYNPNCVVVFGESLGTGVAVEMAKRFNPHALILQSPYTTMGEAAQYNYPYIPAKWLVKDQYDSLSKIPMLQMPIFIFHGDTDDVVPVFMSQQLYDQIKSIKEMHIYPGLTHQNILNQESAEKIINFIETHVTCL